MIMVMVMVMTFIMMIMMLLCTEHDASVAYIDDDDDDDPSLPLYQTMPYVCGKVLLASVLDSLVAVVSIILLLRYISFFSISLRSVHIDVKGRSHAPHRCRHGGPGHV